MRIPVMLVFLLLSSNVGHTMLHTSKERKAEGSKSPVAETSAEEQTSEASTEETSEYEDPNMIPYRTRKSVLAHLLSLPAKVWRLAWTPLGETVIWAEQNRIPQKVNNFFYLNEDRTAALFPALSVGGNTGVGTGFSIFHSNLFGHNERIGLSALYSTSDNNVATFVFRDSTLFGSSFYFDFTGNYFNDNDENLYIEPTVTQEEMDDSSIGANNTSKEDETSYATEEYGGLANLGYAFTDRIGLGIVSSYRHVDISNGEGLGGDDFPRTIPGADEPASLFSIGGALTLNFRHGHPRVLSGPLLRFGFSYNREVSGLERFEFNRFTIEANQFIPIPFMARNRRLAIRGLFEKLARHGEKEIPFYELSMLGDAANLRGFDQNRFSGRGLLLFNFEYRYPVWDLWDAVIFVDQGQVYDDLSDIELGRFHTGYGTGIRFMSIDGFIMRLEIGRSSEQWRLLFQVAPNF